MNIETERLVIDRLRETDKEDYFLNISHDKKVLETFICRYADTLEDFDFSAYLSHDALYAIRLKGSGRLIGIMVTCDETADSCEIGYGLGSGYWGHGYATEAVSAFIGYCFREKGLKSVCASFFTGNDASRRVMEKCGMTYSRFSEKELTYLGLERDLTYYAVTRDAWEENLRRSGLPLLYRAALRGVYGSRREFEKGSITDALFIFLDGEPEPASLEALMAGYMVRPWTCLTGSWENLIRERFPRAETFQRHIMKPLKQFRFPEVVALPDGYSLSKMDEAAFEQHPFSHGGNYASFDTFRKEGSGAVVCRNGEIVASASSFLSLDGEVELDVSTKEEHRGKGLAKACVAEMLRDCAERGIVVHWDAQNDVSLRLAEDFGFQVEREYTVYWAKDEQ